MQSDIKHQLRLHSRGICDANWWRTPIEPPKQELRDDRREHRMCSNRFSPHRQTFAFSIPFDQIHILARLHTRGKQEKLYIHKECVILIDSNGLALLPVVLSSGRFLLSAPSVDSARIRADNIHIISDENGIVPVRMYTETVRKRRISEISHIKLVMQVRLTKSITP